MDYHRGAGVEVNSDNHPMDFILQALSSLDGEIVQFATHTQFTHGNLYPFSFQIISLLFIKMFTIEDVVCSFCFECWNV